MRCEPSCHFLLAELHAVVTIQTLEPSCTNSQWHILWFSVNPPGQRGLRSFCPGPLERVWTCLWGRWWWMMKPSGAAASSSTCAASLPHYTEFIHSARLYAAFVFTVSLNELVSWWRHRRDPFTEPCRFTYWVTLILLEQHIFWGNNPELSVFNTTNILIIISEWCWAQSGSDNVVLAPEASRSSTSPTRSHSLC